MTMWTTYKKEVNLKCNQTNRPIWVGDETVECWADFRALSMNNDIHVSRNPFTIGSSEHEEKKWKEMKVGGKAG